MRVAVERRTACHSLPSLTPGSGTSDHNNIEKSWGMPATVHSSWTTKVQTVYLSKGQSLFSRHGIPLFSRHTQEPSSCRLPFSWFPISFLPCYQNSRWPRIASPGLKELVTLKKVALKLPSGPSHTGNRAALGLAPLNPEQQILICDAQCSSGLLSGPSQGSRSTVALYVTWVT